MNKEAIRKFKNLIIRIYMRIYGTFHKLENKIVFSSFSGRQYSDNPRAICEKMHELFPQFELVWYLRNMNDDYNIIPNYVRISTGRLSFYEELATACCFVTNVAMEPNIVKRKGQYFVQTWHGDRAFKSVLYDFWDSKGEQRPINIIDNKVTDICVAGSAYGTEVYRTAFRYSGEILNVGSPRNDKLIYNSVIYAETIKDKLHIEHQKKVLLYAPTFRDADLSQGQNINLDLNPIIKKLNEGSDRWVCLARAHSLSKGLNTAELEVDCMDVTDYPDMADLLCITDFLITDYSSCACDFVLRKLPVILFIPDIDEYQKSSRTFKANPEQVGFYTAKTTKEILDIIETKSQKNFETSCDKVNKYYGTKESGHASEEVCIMIHQYVENTLGGG